MNSDPWYGLALDDGEPAFVGRMALVASAIGITVGVGAVAFLLALTEWIWAHRG